MVKKKKICLQCRRPEFNPWVSKIPWRREWLLTQVFLPGKFHGQRGLLGYRQWSHKKIKPDWATNITTHTHTHTHTHTLTYIGFPGSASGKEPAWQCRRCKRCGFDPWVRKICWRRHGNPLQYSCLENPMNRGVWWATVHEYTKNWIQLKQLSMHTCMYTHTYTDTHTHFLL